MAPSAPSQSCDRDKRSCSRHYLANGTLACIPPSLGLQLSLGRDRPSTPGLVHSVVPEKFRSSPSSHIPRRSQLRPEIDQNALQLTNGVVPRFDAAGCKQCRPQSLRPPARHPETRRPIEAAHLVEGQPEEIAKQANSTI